MSVNIISIHYETQSTHSLIDKNENIFSRPGILVLINDADWELMVKILYLQKEKNEMNSTHDFT